MSGASSHDFFNLDLRRAILDLPRSTLNCVEHVLESLELSWIVLNSIEFSYILALTCHKVTWICAVSTMQRFLPRQIFFCGNFRYEFVAEPPISDLVFKSTNAFFAADAFLVALRFLITMHSSISSSAILFLTLLVSLELLGSERPISDLIANLLLNNHWCRNKYKLNTDMKICKGWFIWILM